jgi:hypothetical protein
VTEFVPVTAEHCGEDLFEPLVGRGASFADIDGDGDLDFLVMSTGGPTRLLRNDGVLGHNWLRFKLVGSSSNRDAIGATVEVKTADRTLHRQVMPTRSYISQVELPVTFGLGHSDQVEQVTVTWPDGTQQEVTIDGLNQTYEVEQSGSADQGT